MKIPWAKLKKLSLDAIEEFSAVAEFVNARRDYFWTVFKFDALFGALLLLVLGLGVLIVASMTGLVLLPFLAIIAGLVFLLSLYGLDVGLVDLLVNKKKPTLSAVVGSIIGNLGFTVQLGITAAVFGAAFAVISLLVLLSVGIATLVVPLINLTQLLTQVVILPVALSFNFVYVYMAILHFRGVKGWIDLPQKAIDRAMAQKEGIYSLCLGLVLLTSSLPFFFNGGVFIIIVYSLIVFPLVQLITILLPYQSYARKA